MHRRDWFMVLLTALWTSSALACTEKQDQRPYTQRLAEAPLAFIGTVTSVSGLHVTFAVQHTIKGSPDRPAAIEALPPSTCSITFAVGQRWLYAGPATSQPSVLLLANARSVPASNFGRLRRVDDAQAQFPAAWQACNANVQCEPVPIGCRRTAVNAAYAAAARAQSKQILGDHRAMECAIPPTDVQPLAAPQCVASRCGFWSLDLRLGV